LPEIFDQVKVGERVLFNDGKIEGKIREVSQQEMAVEITFAKPTGSKLRADKGINFPDSHLRVQGLTKKDRKHLPFVAEHADVVSMSFVNSPADVEDLFQELDELGNRELGVILKVETRQGYRQLPGILLAAMRRYPVGVMIARGDLAVEVGWQELALVQEEMARICEAAHVPTIWATQVLETLAKKGRPSRAEITDAASSRRAECVMLNKGPHILEAVRLLGTILNDMEEFHAKSAPMLPELGTDWPDLSGTGNRSAEGPAGS
jgi:pyruvate kinase